MSAPAISLLTLNAHQGFAAHRRGKVLLEMRDALRTSNADLVFLQEVGVTEDPDEPANQYEVLADRNWPQYAYGRNAVATRGHHGNALLSKYPIAAWKNIDVSVGKAEPRGMLHCEIRLPWTPHVLHAICVHLALRGSHRRLQVDHLLAHLAHTIPGDAPLVVAGDFNDWRKRAHRRLVHDAALEEIHDDAFGHPARTFPARLPLLRLDRIYVRNLRHRPVRQPRRPWAKLSDHAPLAGEVRL